MDRKLNNEELSRLSLEEYQNSLKTPIIIVLDNVRSLHNVGSAFRTADAFRIEALYLCGITGKPPDREIRKTALGATESVAWSYFSNTIEALLLLKKEGYVLCAVEQTEQSVWLNDLAPISGKKMALIFGNEVHGVAQELIDMCDFVVEIPQVGTKHSLNISVSIGIVIWDLYLKTVLKTAQ
jgi:23S rRNA (guanosine2251-2'-O)-methyltransferase